MRCRSPLILPTHFPVKAHRDLFPFNASFYEQLQNISDTCGYTDYLDKFVTYPPAGQLPLPAGATFDNVTKAVGVQASCRLHSPIQRAVTKYGHFIVCRVLRKLTAIVRINPAFDVYRVSDTFPTLCELLLSFIRCRV